MGLGCEFRGNGLDNVSTCMFARKEEQYDLANWSAETPRYSHSVAGSGSVGKAMLSFLEEQNMSGMSNRSSGGVGGPAVVTHGSG